MTYSFINLGIQCVKKKDILTSLQTRRNKNIDPFRGRIGKLRTNVSCLMFGENKMFFLEINKVELSSYDLSAVRLAFQVFLPGQQGKYDVALEPVVSDPIFDKKTTLGLSISKLSHCSASCAGGQQIILLCEKVIKEDIKVRFFEEVDGKTVWEDYGTFLPNSVHHQFAITLNTPRYYKDAGYNTFKVKQFILNFIKNLKLFFQCFIQLYQQSDKKTSDPLPFDFIPLHDGTGINRKRHRNEPKLDLLRHLQAKLNQPKKTEPNYQDTLACAPGYQPNIFDTNVVEQKPNNNGYIPNVWEATNQYFDPKTVKMQQQEPVASPPNLNFQCPNLTSQTINYNQYIISSQENLKIPENLSELIDPQYNPNRLISTILDIESLKMRNSF